MMNRNKKWFFGKISKFVFIAVSTLIIFSCANSQPPTVSLSTDKTAANPGDKVTFTWKVEDPGNNITRITLKIDGEVVKWSSPYVWTAIPGTHLFFIEVRWGEKAEKKYYIRGYGQVEVSGGEGHFSHPGIYNSQEELDVIKANVNGSSPHPMKDGWQAMLDATSTKHTGSMQYSSLQWKPHAVAIVKPHDGGPTKFGMMDDFRSAYAHALQWVVTGKKVHADKSIEVYNAWSSTFTEMRAYDVYQNLYNSWVGHMAVMGAEIIRHYDNGAAGWKKEDIAKYEDLCRILEILTLEWKGTSEGPYGGHNQDAAVARTRLALGVFLNDQALFDLGTRLLFDVNYENDKIVKVQGHAVNLVGLSIAKDGEIMEFNRGGGDPGHGTGTLNSLTNATEIIRHQEVKPEYNFYMMKLSIDDDKTPRLLLGSEFAANSFINSPTKIAVNDNFVNKRGGKYSEMVLNYYKYLSPVKYDFHLTEKANELFRPQGGQGGYIAPWTTLTHGDLSAEK